MQVKAHITDQKVINHFVGMPDKLDAMVKRGVQRVSQQAVREITGKEGLSRFGRHAAGTPTPSPKEAPVGENPPAQVTTMLRRSVTIMPIRKKGFARYTQTTMPTMAYARIQELGGYITKKGGTVIYIPPRPYVEPARTRLIKSGRAKAIFSAEIRKELKHGG